MLSNEKKMHKKEKKIDLERNVSKSLYLIEKCSIAWAFFYEFMFRDWD